MVVNRLRLCESLLITISTNYHYHQLASRPMNLDAKLALLISQLLETRADRKLQIKTVSNKLSKPCVPFCIKIGWILVA